MTWNRILADLVLTIHFLFALAAVVGAFFVHSTPALIPVHLLIVAWSALVNLAGWTCPLTPLEQRLRRSSGDASYTGSCLYHYLDPLLRPLGMPRRMEMIAGYSILTWNVIVYAGIWAVGQG